MTSDDHAYYLWQAGILFSLGWFGYFFPAGGWLIGGGILGVLATCLVCVVGRQLVGTGWKRAVKSRYSTFPFLDGLSDGIALVILGAGGTLLVLSAPFLNVGAPFWGEGKVGAVMLGGGLGMIGGGGIYGSGAVHKWLSCLVPRLGYKFCQMEAMGEPQQEGAALVVEDWVSLSRIRCCPPWAKLFLEVGDEGILQALVWGGPQRESVAAAQKLCQKHHVTVRRILDTVSAEEMASLPKEALQVILAQASNINTDHRFKIIRAMGQKGAENPSSIPPKQRVTN